MSWTTDIPPRLRPVLLPLVLVASLSTAQGPEEESEANRMIQTPKQILLPRPRTVGSISLEEALARRRSIREYLDAPLSLEEVGQLLWAAQGITDSARGLRTAPSAGALYPLEIRLLAWRVNGLSPGLYRYDPYSHTLVNELPGDLRTRLSEAALGQEPIRRAPCLLLISGVVARTAVKYGSRAERYVLMEAGHSSENVYLQAASIGLGTVCIGAFYDDRAREALQLPPEERLLYIMPVGKPTGVRP